MKVLRIRRLSDFCPWCVQVLWEPAVSEAQFTQTEAQPLDLGPVLDQNWCFRSVTVTVCVVFTSVFRQNKPQSVVFLCALIWLLDFRINSLFLGVKEDVAAKHFFP